MLSHDKRDERLDQLDPDFLGWKMLNFVDMYLFSLGNHFLNLKNSKFGIFWGSEIFWGESRFDSPATVISEGVINIMKMSEI